MKIPRLGRYLLGAAVAIVVLSQSRVFGSFPGPEGIGKLPEIPFFGTTGSHLSQRTRIALPPVYRPDIGACGPISESDASAVGRWHCKIRHHRFHQVR
jgi:hypothetical protein